MNAFCSTSDLQCAHHPWRASLPCFCPGFARMRLFPAWCSLALRARTTLASENDARERERQPAPREHSTSLECETSSAPLAASVVWVPRYSHAPRVSAQGRGGGARKRGSNAQALCHATPERGPDLYEMLLVQIVDLNIIPFLERKDAPSSCGPGFARRTPHFGTWTPRKNGARHGSCWQPGVCNV